MLRSFGKFSQSIYAKILLGIIVIPFIFWGMGSQIRGGNKNIVLTIDKDKYSIQEINNFIKRNATEKVESDQIDEFLSSFINEKLIEKEVEYYGIKLSNKSLSKLIKHQKEFKRENKFSRTEYEKFLLKNNITAIDFESIISRQEKKRQLLDFIGGGVLPSNFLVNISYNNINQKRIVEIINLNDAFLNQLNFSEKQIKNYFENNNEKYTEVYKSLKFLELNPKMLVGNNEFTDLFFKKIDEIDDSIISGNNLDFIIQKFNLEKANLIKIDRSGKDTDSKINDKISKNMVEKIFNMDELESTSLFEDDNKYFVVQLLETKRIQKNIEDEFIKNQILSDLNTKTKGKLTAEIIAKINKNNFTKFNFDKLSKDTNAKIKKISLKNINDDKILKKQIVNEIYSFPEKRIIVVNAFDFSENYLIYIEKVQNVSINKNSDEYKKYVQLSQIKIANDLYNSYDNYLSKKYKIDINHQALEAIKNYFN